jgi:hypothetical protein
LWERIRIDVSNVISVITGGAREMQSRRTLMEGFTDEQFRHLWQSVLLRAWEDAIGEHLVTNEGRAKRMAYVKDAREWLMTESEDLMDVCSRAGIDHKAVMRKARGIWG